MAELTTDDLVALWKRFTAKTWVRGLTAGIREQILRGAAAIAARASRLVERDMVLQGHILTATGPRVSSGVVKLTIPSMAVVNVTVEAPVTLLTADGRRFVTTQDATFGIGDTESSDASAESLFASFESNVGALEIVAVDLDTVPAGVLASLPGLAATNAAPFTGGSAPVLDLHARSVGLRRLSNEADEQLRDRIRNAPDTVTPAAVLGAANRALQPGGKQAALDEPTPGLPPNANVNPQPVMGQFFADRGFFCDGGLVLQSVATSRACFTIRLPAFQSMRPTTLYADRLRFLDRGYFADGGEPEIEARYAGVVQAVTDAKAAGVLPLFRIDTTL